MLKVLFPLFALGESCCLGDAARGDANPAATRDLLTAHTEGKLSCFAEFGFFDTYFEA